MDKQYFKLLINFINAGNYLCKMAINITIFIFDFKIITLTLLTVVDSMKLLQNVAHYFLFKQLLNNDGIQEFSTSVNKKFTVPSFSPILNIVKFTHT